MRECLLIAVAANVLWCADTFVPLNIKAGNWETTITTQTTGKMPVPQQLLSQMTPEQRAKFEAARAKQPNTSTKTTTSQRCLTNEDLAKPLELSDSSGCKTTLTVSTTTRMEGQLSCSQVGVTMSGTMKAEAVNPELVKLSYAMKSGDGTDTITINATATSKWVGATCAPKDK